MGREKNSLYFQSKVVSIHPGKLRPGETGCQEGDPCASLFLFSMLLWSSFSLWFFLGFSAWFSQLGALPSFLSVSGPFAFGSCIVSASCLDTAQNFSSSLQTLGWSPTDSAEYRGSCSKEGCKSTLDSELHPSRAPVTTPRYLGWRGAREQLRLACRLPCVLSSPLPRSRDATQPWPLLAWNLYKCSWCSLLNGQKQRTEPGKPSDPRTLVHENYRRRAGAVSWYVLAVGRCWLISQDSEVTQV